MWVLVKRLVLLLMTYTTTVTFVVTKLMNARRSDINVGNHQDISVAIRILVSKIGRPPERGAGPL